MLLAFVVGSRHSVVSQIAVPPLFPALEVHALQFEFPAESPELTDESLPVLTHPYVNVGGPEPESAFVIPSVVLYFNTAGSKISKSDAIW